MNTHTPEPWFICTTEPAEIRTHPYGGVIIGETIPNAYNARRAVECVNACAGMAAPAKEIQAMRDAIKEAIPCLDTDRDLTDQEIQGTHPKLIARRAALRKLQTFIQP